MIYLDYAATTPVSDTALEVYQKVAARYYGNASSMHDIGSDAEQVLEASRKTIAKIIGANPRHIYFTSGGSESNMLAIFSLVEGNKHRGNHLITTTAEHSSVRNVFRKLEQQGYDITWLPVDGYGMVDKSELVSAIREDTILASIQHANSEIGTIQPIGELAELLKSRGVLFHADCVQTFGKLAIDIQSWQADALSFSAHKIYGPKGVGAVWMNPKSGWKPFIPSVTHEGGFVQGTSNVPGIAAFSAAAKEIMEERQQMMSHFEELRKFLFDGLKQLEWSVEVEGHPDKRLPNIAGLRFPGIEGQFLMLECSQAGVGIATGSACQTNTSEPAISMVATGKTGQEALEFVRLSVGKMTTKDEIAQAISKIDGILHRHFAKVSL